MHRSGLLMLALLVSARVHASDMVGVPGSNAAYPTTIDAVVAGKTVKLNLTGTALRTKVIVNVYAIGSYVQNGVSVRTAEELAAADCAKRLHLVMERTVDGKDLGEAFRSAIRLNHPEPEFTDEVN